MAAKQQPLQAGPVLDAFSAKLTNLRVTEKEPIEELEGVPALVAEAESALQAEGGRVLLRYSGTEPKIRLLLGGDAAALDAWSEKIVSAIAYQIGEDQKGGQVPPRPRPNSLLVILGQGGTCPSSFRFNRTDIPHGKHDQMVNNADTLSCGKT